MNKSFHNRFPLILAWASASLLSLSTVSHGQVIVDPSNLGIWSFGTADGNGNPANGNSGDITQFVNGPSTTLLGTGSVELSTASGHGDDAAFISTNAYNGTLLSNLTTLSYATYDTVNNGSQFPYIQLSISTTGTGPADDILFFEPPYQTPSTGDSGLPTQGATAMNTWQVWSATTGGWWSNDGNANLNPGTGVGPLSQFLAEFPDATIEANPFAGGGIELSVGYGDPSDNYTGYVDDITIGTVADGTTVYNMEDAAPEPSTWTMVLGGLVLLSFCVRRQLA